MRQFCTIQEQKLKRETRIVVHEDDAKDVSDDKRHHLYHFRRSEFVTLLYLVLRNHIEIHSLNAVVSSTTSW